MARTVGIVLAAGQGKRMRSRLPKVLHPVGGAPMIEHVLSALEGTGVDRCLVVVGREGDAIRRALGDRVEYVVQEEPLGTGHALLQARSSVAPEDDALVLYGDTPLLTPALLTGLLRRHREAGAAATMLTVELEDPRGYGRVLRDAEGEVARVVEEADAGPDVLGVREVNAGIYCFRAGAVFPALAEVRPSNRQGEYYLVDVIPLLRARGLRVEAVRTDDPLAVTGVNTRADLAAAEAALRRRAVERLWAAGVTVADPAATLLGPRVRAGGDTVVYPFTAIEGPVEIGEGCRIGPGTWIRAGAARGR